ncbi:hypothetical protein EGT33_09025 [Burkholderia multivorans]|nr:hypothetical protein EGT33_09025 [Burkholderia multivorans]
MRVEHRRESAGARPLRPVSTDMGARGLPTLPVRGWRHCAIGHAAWIVADAPASIRARADIAAIEIGIAGSSRSG